MPDSIETIDELPVFPLGTVLFPGGKLPLRIFEARYIDMIRRCMRDGSAFGVCRITSGTEVGQPAEHEPIGCLGRIDDWDMAEPGVLQIMVRGDRRFQIGERKIAKDGLITARVELLADDRLEPVPEDLQQSAQLLRTILVDLESRATDSARNPIASPYQFDSCAWVANRLCELLPIPISAKQKLMELNDPSARLSLVQQFLQQRKIL